MLIDLENEEKNTQKSLREKGVNSINNTQPFTFNFESFL